MGRSPAANAAGARIPPAGWRELGLANSALAWLASRPTGAKRPLAVFATLGRHRRLFRVWLPFARQLLRRGVLSPADRELLILRAARNCGSDYEWAHHAKLGEGVGLSAELIAGIAEAEPAETLDRRQHSLVRACDELHRDRRITDSTWAELSEWLFDAQLIELCMVVGHYEMLAMTLNSLGTVPEQDTHA
jgi:alkylhydroperoxidase family enzyme